MFWFFNKENVNKIYKGNFKEEQKLFLEDADKAYTDTFKKLDMTGFAKYASRSLYMVVYRSLSYERPWASVSDKFKTTTWFMLDSNSDGSFSVKKETVFDKVRVSKDLKLSISNDIVEKWDIKVKSNKYYIDNIVQLEGGY